MKNSLLIFLFLIFTGTAVNAQEDVLFGAKGGLDFTNMTDENIYNSDARIGFHLGLLAEIPLTARFAIQPEVLYSTQGAEVEVLTYGGSGVTYEYKMDYIQVPALAKIYLLQDLSIEVGPSFNFLVKEERNGEEIDYGNTFELGAALGASYRLGARFFGSARYTQGFTDVFENSTKNNGFQIGIGLMF